MRAGQRVDLRVHLVWQRAPPARLRRSLGAPPLARARPVSWGRCSGWFRPVPGAIRRRATGLQAGEARDPQVTSLRAGKLCWLAGVACVRPCQGWAPPWASLPCAGGVGILAWGAKGSKDVKLPITGEAGLCPLPSRSRAFTAIDSGIHTATVPPTGRGLAGGCCCCCAVWVPVLEPLALLLH